MDDSKNKLLEDETETDERETDITEDSLVTSTENSQNETSDVAQTETSVTPDTTLTSLENQSDPYLRLNASRGDARESGTSLEHSTDCSTCQVTSEEITSQESAVFRVRQISSIKDPLVAVINEGTGSVRFVLYSTTKKAEIGSCERDLATICPQEGWSEQDPLDILAAVKECISNVLKSLSSEQLSSIATIGITNQRETTLVWDKITGEPLYNAILWSDIRTDSTVDTIIAKLGDKDSLKRLCGLPVSPYFSALKLKWLLDNVPAVRQAVLKKRCYFGTIDSWIVWNLTGGVDGGIHVTDVTNASRTMLMNIDTLKWDPTLCKHFGIPLDMLPEIRSSSEIYGTVKGGPLGGKPISGILGNQHSALVGQGCLHEGEAKNTYRSGCFLLYNTGRNRVYSSHGLITTVCYQFGKDSKPVYGLEGSVAVAGMAVKWLRDNLGLLNDTSETESLAEEVMTTGDVYFVPAFNGLFAPYWRKDARGIICGLTQFTTKGHIIRAALEAVCFQTRDILEAMHKDCGVPLTRLKVDGKMTSNRLLMQLQADLCGIPVVRTGSCDITSYGVALAAGWAKGIEVWDKKPELCYDNDMHATTFHPTTSLEERNHRYTKWKMAVKRSLGWAKHKRHPHIPMPEERYRLLASIPGTLFIFSSFCLMVLTERWKI